MKFRMFAQIGLFALGSALLSASPAAAQDGTLMDHLRKAEKAGTTLRVTTATAMLDGRVSSLNDSTFSIRNQRVLVQDVTTLHRKSGSSTGAKVGALVGALVIGAGGAVVWAMCSSNCTDTRRVMLTSAGIVTGGVLGGLIGGGLDDKKEVLGLLWARPGGL